MVGVGVCVLVAVERGLEGRVDDIPSMRAAAAAALVTAGLWDAASSFFGIWCNCIIRCSRCAISYWLDVIHVAAAALAAVHVHAWQCRSQQWWRRGGSCCSCMMTVVVTMNARLEVIIR